MNEPRPDDCLYCHGTGFLERVRIGRRGKSSAYKERCRNCRKGSVTADELIAQRTARARYSENLTTLATSMMNHETVLTNPPASVIAEVWDAMVADRDAYSLSTCAAWQDDVAREDTLLTLVYHANALCFAAWMHHMRPVGTWGLLGWMGGWAHPDWRGSHIRRHWQLCRASFVDQGITVFCTAVEPDNRRSILAVRHLMGFWHQAGYVHNLYRNGKGELLDARLFVEEPIHIPIAQTASQARALAETKLEEK